MRVTRMGQRVLPEQNFGGAQDSAHGRIAAQMPSVQPKLQSEEQPEDAPSDAYGCPAGSQGRNPGNFGLEDHFVYGGQTSGGAGDRPPADSEERHDHA